MKFARDILIVFLLAAVIVLSIRVRSQERTVLELTGHLFTLATAVEQLQQFEIERKTHRHDERRNVGTHPCREEEE